MKRQKKVHISVINDLVTDQRVARTARVLQDLGFEVQLVGRRLTHSPSMPPRPYPVLRMRLLWERGPLFYAEYNTRLFFHLLSQKSDLLVSNDLDTLLPNFLVSRIKRIPLVYDSHEYYTETPELTGRPRIQKIWKRIERAIIPKLKHCITVNQGIAELFEKEYNVPFHVVRNIPDTREMKWPTTPINRLEAGLEAEGNVLILQGSGINIQRGAEELVECMQWVATANLLIVGGGDVIGILKTRTRELGLKKKIIFIPRVEPSELRKYTILADIGLSLDKDTNINYHYSLPNKIFDYIHAGVPILASNLPEIARIVEKYQVGELLESHQPRKLAEQINRMLQDRSRLAQFRANALQAALALNWEKEKQVLVDIFSQYA